MPWDTVQAGGSQEQYLWRKAGSNRLSLAIASPYGGLMALCRFHLHVFWGFGEGLVPFPQRVSVEDTGGCCCWKPSTPWIIKVITVAVFSAQSQTCSQWVLVTAKVDFCVWSSLWYSWPGSQGAAEMRRVSRLGTPEFASLLFADDVILLALSVHDLQHVLEWFSTICEETRRRVSTSKWGGWVRDGRA